MKFYSTNKKSNPVSFKEAVIKGIANDGGLFMPQAINKLPDKFFKEIENLSFHEIAFQAAKNIIEDELNESELNSIIEKAINFPAPLIDLDEDNKILELFHGPTLAFKDFGARFMAETLSLFVKNNDKEINILAATSGDTGSAVANGFYKTEGIRVILLYPSGKVSEIQEKQLTTLGKNITVFEVDGTFDDCQKMVKEAFTDRELNNKLILSSANSINIARLIPQSFYYFFAYKQLKQKSKLLFISVPSGNFGNLTGGLFAKKMGLPVDKFIAAVNSNNVFPVYLDSGKFIPKPSVETISNAMDVGSPSNFHRITDLFDNDLELIKNVIFSSSFSDDLTKSEIKKVYEKYNYVIDPHGAVGFLALEEFIRKFNFNDYNGIVLETAHPAKFIDIMENIVNKKIVIPERLKTCLSKEKRTLKISNKFQDFKNLLMN